jgi:hypothetical protein
MIEERTGKCSRKVEHSRGNLRHRYSISVNQAIVTSIGKKMMDKELCQNQCNADVCITTRTGKHHYVLLTMKLLIQELKSSRRQLYACYNGLVYRYGISVSQITTAMFYLSRTLSSPLFYFSLEDIHFILLHMGNCDPFSTRHLFNEITVSSLIMYPFYFYIVICFCVIFTTQRSLISHNHLHGIGKKMMDKELCQNQCNADVCITTITDQAHVMLLTRKLLGGVSSSCFTSDTRHVNLATNPVINHEWGKDREVLMTGGKYPWSFATQIFQAIVTT